VRGPQLIWNQEDRRHSATRHNHAETRMRRVGASAQLRARDYLVPVNSSHIPARVRSHAARGRPASAEHTQSALNRLARLRTPRREPAPNSGWPLRAGTATASLSARQRDKRRTRPGPTRATRNRPLSTSELARGFRCADPPRPDGRTTGAAMTRQPACAHSRSPPSARVRGLSCEAPQAR
jgi:hypothetical protein